MASFADKVRSTNALPSSNGQQRGQPVIPTMTDEIEEDLIEAITLQSNEAGIHPTKATDGEQLPEGYTHSYGGFLLRQEPRIVRVDQRLVQREMEFLSRHVLMAFFVGGRPSQHTMPQWLETLQRQARGHVGIGRNLGRGFFQLRAKDAGTAQKLLTLTPFKSRWGNCVMQKWIPNFDSANPRGMKIPTWITLRRVPDEFQFVARQIAEGLDEVLGGDK